MSYQDIKDKLYHGHKRLANNTNLILIPKETIDGVEFPEYVVMNLHGHAVVKFYPDHLELFSAGWHTPTTKNRLNLALELAGIPGGIRQRDWCWFYGTFGCIKPTIDFKDGMKIDYTGKVYT